MLRLYTKKGCRYCIAMKTALDSHRINYDEVTSTGAVPRLELDGEMIFKGLPDYNTLIEFINNYNARTN